MLKVDLNSVSALSNTSNKNILQSLNFEIEKGKVYSILGKNGSGKSTLIKSLSALLPTNQYEVMGKVLFDGLDLLSATDEKFREIRRSKIRYVFQDAVNSFDPLKKLKYYFDLTDVNPIKIEGQLLFFLLPTYKELSKLHSYELSGGMAQRLLIVLALLANPDLLILDEPTSGVDYAVTNLVLIKISEFVKENDKSILIVTQDLNFAIKSSNYIAYLSNGTLSSFLKPDDFIKSKSDEEINNFIQSFSEISNASA
ncbi:MAG: ATP-binding cassette domain-containing protein [Ignavibacteria bacterium]|nr:ATP-binding cassette domain-containing protein [Ignavibacteria bacterium]MBT8381201.1 ATP-binding cassette domain-containing protein [Ignavibacteria bacterium]MBT8390535.1 ATP-binding cassette domain-containing protein [Ignavibacteria bacterium]NNJ52841.1 ABC transporter ATP-binding protein [Ignavibacteriaceae bacterium]NNL21519.1 ABC transporter ATP-binding protein [Ignavibacteriaceae bacterium]